MYSNPKHDEDDEEVGDAHVDCLIEGRIRNVFLDNGALLLG